MPRRVPAKRPFTTIASGQDPAATGAPAQAPPSIVETKPLTISSALSKLEHPLRHLIALLAGLALLGLAALVQAQPAGDPWSEPVNLSRSGGAGHPQLVVDADGVTHVIWPEGALGRFVYSRFDGRWSEPTAVSLPFGGAATGQALYTPQLVAGAGGRLHAFWITSERGLFYSSVAAAELADPFAWSSPEQLAESALSSAAAVDAAGRLHLAYIRPADTAQLAAGVYYRRSPDGGASWSGATTLYQSAYFRALRGEDGNIQVAAGDGELVYVGWDNRPQERIFLARSSDGGQSWAAAEEIDRRQETDDLAATGPSRLRLAAAGAQLHLLWQAGHDGAACTPYYQWSGDGGQSWPVRRPLLDGVAGCPEMNRLLIGPGGVALLLTALPDNVYLLTLSDGRQSEPVAQPPLRAFTNPDIFRPVNIGCLQTGVAGARLVVAGCDPERNEVWALSRTVDALVAPPTPSPTSVWAAPAAVDLAEGEGQRLAPRLLAGADGRFHTLWTQSAATGDSLAAGQAIWYARWEGGQWSRPAAVLRSPSGKAEAPAVALDNRGRLLVAWSGGETGQVYYSWAAAARANSASEWIPPVALPIPEGAARPAGGSPAILVDRANAIFVAFAVPVNEGRGIYLTRSTDDGQTWSTPVAVFDAAAAGWEAVGGPQLALTANDHLHLLWQRPGGAADSLYYARSTDRGESWSPAARMTAGAPAGGAATGGAATAAVIWRALAGLGDRVVHRAWQEWDGSRAALWHQVSIDDGRSWSRPGRVGDLGSAGGPAGLVIDGAGRPFLLQLARPAAGDPATAVLRQWQWLDDRWQAGEDLTLALAAPLLDTTLAAAAAPDGQLGVLFGERRPDAVGAGIDQLVFTSRSLDPPAVAPTPLPTLTPTPPPAPTVTPTARPQPTATAVFPTTAGTSPPVSLDLLGANGGIVTGVLLALIPALLIVVGVTIAYARAGRKGR